MNQFIIRCYRKLDYLHLMDWMPDKMYLSLKFRVMMDKKLHLKNPQTFNEKLQWLKLYNRNPDYVMMVDKYKVRDYVAKTIGEEYLIPLLGVWDSPDEIDFDSLPNQFVLKCNHNSGRGMCICTDKSKLDIEAVKRELQEGLNENYYITNREWPYKDVPRKIIAEKYMVDESGTELKDYKFMCFNGRVQCSFVCSDRFSEDGLKVTFYDREWKKMPFIRHYPSSTKDIDMPKQYHAMIEFAERLSKNIPFVRVDFYEVDGHLYFGELTFYPGNGMEEFKPEEWDYKLGDWIKLPGGGGVEFGWMIELSNDVCIWVHSCNILNESHGLKDYKLFCFNGEPKLTLVCSDRFSTQGLHEDFFDNNWVHQDIARPNIPNSIIPTEKPYCFEEMLELSRKLSKRIPFARIDFYEILKRPYFGEITFYPASGMNGFVPDNVDAELGEKISLPIDTE